MVRAIWWWLKSTWWQLSYWIRPYDMLADRRRWRWQPRQRCGLPPLKPIYDAAMEPRYPCREMPTRHCPAVYGNVCGSRPCARYESEDQAPWWPEVTR